MFAKKRKFPKADGRHYCCMAIHMQLGLQ